MNEVFRVELFGEKTDRWCELELPASYYGLQDALDKIQMPLGDKPRWEFLEHHSFQFLHVHLTHECDLYQLNALATCLGQMNGRERTAFEGLFNMEVAKKYGPISVATMIDLAYSADCCHVVNATTDEQLGRFYAENDFIPALEKVPDSIFEYLDFEMLGRKARFEEGGFSIASGRGTPIAMDCTSLLLLNKVLFSIPHLWAFINPAKGEEIEKGYSVFGKRPYSVRSFCTLSDILPAISTTKQKRTPILIESTCVCSIEQSWTNPNYFLPIHRQPKYPRSGRFESRLYN